jgi:hypothetical protein
VALEALHGQVIDGALSAMQLNNPYERCTLDTDLHCAPPFVTSAQLRQPTLYRGSNAALHLALRRPPRAPRPDLQVPDPLDPFAVTVLVTDGFQSTHAAFQPNAAADVACTAGADPSCLAALLRRRVDEGYGVWVLRVTLPFEGRYFAERRLDATMWSRVTAHVEELNRDPAWNGVRFAAGRPSFGTDSGAFQWSGARPLLLFVLSRDVPRARGLLAEMVRRLAVERIGRRGTSEDFTWAEWAPYEGLSAQVAAASRADRGPAADALRVDPAGRAQGAFVVPVRCSIEGKSRILLQGAVAYGVQAPPPWARIDLGWRLLTPPAGELLVPREPLRAAPGAFQVYTGLDCTVLNAGRYSYDLALWARWTVDDAALSQQWFSRESADTSYEMPERMFGLADLARSVVTAGVQREGALDRVTLRLRRE